ncbi:excinuclease ABC subunit A [Rheinheimera sp. MMS21-TC3]|uniref:excinuclease ABC subunit A n=1 Tax=Rheinheimera sp. MMS21-TC3 TaxID=3072790 RepID=UPI0028C3E314|nr:excinuclease ABC subunit A [Rheinheimera sp. MMS21-TC3]WNO59547.1 excinuclease ABC subunit A [Rheinheimera sp. MMS21-TC3]
MKTKLILAAALSTVFFCGTAAARDNVLTMPLADIVGTDKAKQALLDVPFYFAGQNHPKVSNSWGDISTNKKTNGLGKSDDEACQWVLLSAIKALQEAAQKRGYDAVINIRSNYKNNEFSSATEYNCGAGRIMAGVALKGELVKF